MITEAEKRVFPEAAQASVILHFSMLEPFCWQGSTKRKVGHCTYPWNVGRSCHSWMIFVWPMTTPIRFSGTGPKRPGMEPPWAALAILCPNAWLHNEGEGENHAQACSVEGKCLGWHRMRWTSSLSVSYPTRMRMCWPGLWTTQKRDGLHFGESLSLAGTNPYWCCIFSMFGKCMSITENDHSYSVLHFCLFLVNFICLAYLFLLLVGSQNIVTPITENKTLSFL